MNNALAVFAANVLREIIVAGFRSSFVQQAQQLVLCHGLRTLDALQLAAALELHLLSPVFLCADERLRLVAETTGLAVLDLMVAP